MSNDKPYFEIKDLDTRESIWCDKITGTELSWIYLHYVTMDNTVALYPTNKDDEYLCTYFDQMLRGIYVFGIQS